jgi:hypothetical protein
MRLLPQSRWWTPAVEYVLVPRRAGDSAQQGRGECAGGQPMKQWCKYCQILTQPAPARPGRPRACSVCLRPFESDQAQAPQQTAEPWGTQAQSTAVVSPPRTTPEAQPVPNSPCFHLRNRNNSGTFHPMPHKRNACYARLHVRHPWWRPTAALVPAKIPQEHQARYCFADYPTYPYFLPIGTPPRLLRNNNASTASSSPAPGKRP